MPVTRKQQVLGALETTEGGGHPSSFSSADAIQAYEPALSDNVDISNRVPSGPTLSRDFTPVGRKTRQLTFQSDFRGSGSNATAPDFSRLLRACGYKVSALEELTINGAPTNGGWQVGEIVWQGASYAAATDIGVVLAVFSSAGVKKARASADNDVVLVVVVGGTAADGFSTAVNITGQSSGAVAQADARDTTDVGHAFQTTSQKLIQLALDGGPWTLDPPAGTVLKVIRGGIRVGSVQVIVDSSPTSKKVALLWGSIADGDTLNGGTTFGTSDVNGAPTMSDTPSLVFKHNMDGRSRQLLGARGDFTLDGDVGSPMVFNWTFSGDIGDTDDEPALVTSGLSTVTAPRLLGAVCAFGIGTDVLTLQTKSVSVNNGGTVSPNLDANREGGSTGSNVTDREPEIQVTVDVSHSTFDWEAARDAGTPIRFAVVAGDSRGNTVAIAAPVCQVTGVTPSDADGIATWDVTLAPKRIAESGDDDLYFAQL